MKAGRAGGAAAVLGVAAAVSVAATRPAEQLASDPAPDAATWRPLAAPPAAAKWDVDGAAITSARRRLYLAVVDRGGGRSSLSKIHTFRLDGQRWRALGVLALNRDEPFFLTGGDRACVISTVRRDVLTRCITAVQHAWRQVGGTAFTTTYPSPGVALAGAFVAGGRVHVVRGDARFKGASRRRFVHRVLQETDNDWGLLGQPDIDGETALGTQRVAGLSRQGRPCLVYDALSDDPSRGPSVRHRCIQGETWHAMSPPLPLKAVSPSFQAGREAINVDGAAFVAGRLFVGVDHFRPAQTNWPVFYLTRGRWRAAEFPAQPAGWNAQGSLYGLGGVLWAVRFDQRPTPSGLHTRLVALRRDRDGKVRQVGQPLIENQPLRGPLYWGMAEANGRIFLAATIPASPAGRNTVRVFTLQQPATSR